MPYVYRIAKYEISREMIEKANAAGGLGITLADMTNYGGNGPNRPATGVNWNEAARFVTGGLWWRWRTAAGTPVAAWLCPGPVPGGRPGKGPEARVVLTMKHYTTCGAKGQGGIGWAWRSGGTGQRWTKLTNVV